MSYKAICDVCGLLGKRSYYGNAEKIANLHMSRLKNKGHEVAVVHFNALIDSLKKSE